MGAENLNPFDELKRLDGQIETVSTVGGLKPILFRLEEIQRQNATNFDVQLLVGDIKDHLVKHGTNLRGQQATPPIPTLIPTKSKMPSVETARNAARLRVFLCHASSDKALVRELYSRLRSDGFDPWLDEEHLLPGQRWREVIPAEVRRADIVLVCLSGRSITKTGYVQKEITIALDAADEKPENTLFLIPAKLEDCELPNRLRDWHCVNLFESGGYERLLKSLRSNGS